MVAISLIQFSHLTRTSLQKGSELTCRRAKLQLIHSVLSYSVSSFLNAHIVLHGPIFDIHEQSFKESHVTACTLYSTGLQFWCISTISSLRQHAGHQAGSQMHPVSSDGVTESHQTSNDTGVWPLWTSETRSFHIRLAGPGHGNHRRVCCRHCGPTVGSDYAAALTPKNSRLRTDSPLPPFACPLRHVVNNGNDQPSLSSPSPETRHSGPRSKLTCDVEVLKPRK